MVADHQGGRDQGRVKTASNRPTSGNGPTLPTFAVQQVVGYLGYTGRNGNAVVKTARSISDVGSTRGYAIGN